MGIETQVACASGPGFLPQARQHPVHHAPAARLRHHEHALNPPVIGPVEVAPLGRDRHAGDDRDARCDHPAPRPRRRRESTRHAPLDVRAVQAQAFCLEPLLLGERHQRRQVVCRCRTEPPRLAARRVLARMPHTSGYPSHARPASRVHRQRDTAASLRSTSASRDVSGFEASPAAASGARPSRARAYNVRASERPAAPPPATSASASQDTTSY